MSNLRNVITISFGTQLFDTNNHEHVRHVAIARELTSLDMIVFTRRSDGYTTVVGESGLTVHPTNSRNKILMVWDAVRIAKTLISKRKPSPIVTTQDPAFAGLVGLVVKWQTGVRLVVQEHCDVFSTDHWRTESLKNLFSYYLSLFVLRRADVVRVVTNRSTATLRRFGVTAPITKLSVAVDVARFQAARTTRPHSDEGFTFVSMARFVQQKNLPLLVRAFAAAYQIDQRLRLQLVGRGPGEVAVRAEIAKHFPPAPHTEPPITITRWTDDPVAVLRGADAYVLSSNYEGYGRVLLEALAAQLPLVTTDVGCVGEVITGETAEIISVGDEAALTAALLHVAHDHARYQHMVAAAAEIDPRTLAGGDLSSYGRAWVSSLTPGENFSG